ncbi:MAG: hypothetical protein ACHQ5A_13010 [Opitutales bacterium]
MSSATPSAANAPDVVLLPAERFFVRRVTVAPDSPLAAQLELALETLSPFPPSHLYHGFIVDPSGTEALVYATHRRNYSAEETAGWDSSRAVLPAFAPSLTPATLPAAGLGWRRQEGTIEAYAWDGRRELPVLLLARPLPPEGNAAALRDTLLGEVRQRAGLPATSPVRELPRTSSVTPVKQGGLHFQLEGTEAGIGLVSAQLDTMDVRDKVQLGEQRRLARRNQWLWRAFATGCAGLAACLLLEAGLLGGRLFLRAQRTLVEARADAVGQIKSTQELATRLGEMSSQQLRPFEMLAAVNTQRPASISFLRVATTGRQSLEVEAQTGNPADLREFESRLKSAPGIATTELRDPRSRDGLTTFLLEVTFQPDFLKKGGGS